MTDAVGFSDQIRRARAWIQERSLDERDEITEEIRKQRFDASLMLSAGSLVLFCSFALMSQGPRTTVTAVSALVIFAILAGAYIKKRSVDRSAKGFIAFLVLIVFASSFNDGQIYSELLWLVLLAPLLSSYLLTRRAWILTTLASIAAVCSVWWIQTEFEFNQEMPEGPTDMVIMRIAILLTFAGIALFATMTTQRQNRMLEDRERAIEQVRLASESAVQAKSRFLANMSHEIRTPMHGILGTTELLRKCGLSPRQAKAADVIEGCGQALLRTLNNILDMSKIEAGKFKIEPRTFSAGQWRQDLERRWRPHFEGKGLQFEIQATGAQNVAWVTDNVRLTLVVDHLLHNALRFSDSGTVQWSIHTALAPNVGRAQVHQLEMIFKDCGPGISESDKDRIFDGFERDVNADALGAQGMGLGLTISRRVLELMGARIELLNPGDSQGACFRVCVPIGVVKHAPKRRSTTIIMDARSLEGIKILVADDQPINLKIAKTHLEELGCEVTTAEDGELALRAAQSQSFDLILMDINMPKLDGWEAANAIHAEAPANLDTPIIALSADDEISGEELRERGGMIDHVCKPFTRASLRSALARHIAPDSPD